MTDTAHATHGGTSSGFSSSNISPTTTTSDPFAAHRTPDNNPYASGGGMQTNHDDDVFRRASDGSDYIADNRIPIPQRDRRMSKEWDAAKTPPSKFQKAEGSIFATPSSRDGHVARNKVHGFKEKVKEMKRSVGGGLGGKEDKVGA